MISFSPAVNIEPIEASHAFTLKYFKQDDFLFHNPTSYKLFFQLEKFLDSFFHFERNLANYFTLLIFSDYSFGFFIDKKDVDSSVQFFKTSWLYLYLWYSAKRPFKVHFVRPTVDNNFCNVVWQVTIKMLSKISFLSH